MKIREFRVDGFGVWTGLDVARINEPLVVFFGANEAGKTTLMQFVRAVLYGFSPDRRNRYLPPVGGGKPGGALVVEDGHHQFVVRRHTGRHDDEEQLEVTDRDGARREGRPLALLLDGVDESVFNNVFAFGLSEIQELSTLSDSAAAELLYELTLGLDRVSLSEVVHELETSRQRLLADDGRPSQIPQLAAERERLRAEIRELGQGTGRFLELVRQRQELDRTARQLEEQEATLDEQLQILALARQVEPRWRNRQDLLRRLTALGTLPTLPDNVLAQLDELKARLATRRKRLERVSERRKERVSEAERLNINEALCRQTSRLEALAEQQQWIAALDQQSRQLETELAELSVEHKQHAGPHEHAPAHGRGAHAGAAAGPAAPKPAPAAPKPLSPHTIAALRTQGKALVQLHRRASKSHAEMTRHRESAHGFKRQVQTHLGAGQRESLPKAVERAGALVSQLRRRVQLDERLDQLDRRRHELDEKAHDSLDRQVIPTWQLVGLGSIFALGVALIVGSLILPSALLHGSGWLLAALGVVATAVTGLTTYGMQHMAGRHLDDCQERLQQLQEQVEQAQQERDELDKQLPRGGGPLAARLQTAEKELARLEELMPLDTQRQSGMRGYKLAKGERQAAIGEFKKARQRWRQALSEAGLPADLTPRQLRETIERGRQLQVLHRRLEEKRAQLTDCRRQHEILAERIHQVAIDSHLEIEETDALPLLREMLRRLQDEQLRVNTRDQLRAQLVRLRRVRRKLIRQVAAAQQRLEGLFHSSGAHDEDDLRRRAGIVAEAQRLDRERQLVDEEISAALAGRDEQGATVEHLEAGDDLLQRTDETTAAKQTLRNRLGRVWEERGALLEQIKSLSHDRRQADKRAELAAVNQRLRQARHRWQVICTCSLALDSVRAVYERERQPEVLREASEYFNRLTAGRYTRAWTSLGHRVLWVDDAAGKPLAVEKLSRGTREQLFLSLRLALVSAYARRGVRLPIVMDDVLVNFDVGRVQAAVNVLREFVQAGHQVLLFTCHEHIARLFRSARVEVRALPGNTLRADEPVEREPMPSPVPAPHFLPEPAPEPPADDELTLAELEPEDLPEPRSLPPVEPEPLPVAPRLASPPARPARPAKPRRPRPSAEPVVRRRLVHDEHWVDSVSWSAEEFAGELADRVRRSEPRVEIVDEPATHDEELFEVQFDEAGHSRRNGKR